MIETRILSPGDEPAVEGFLARHTDSSMILRSNLRSHGVRYRGQPFEAVWAAALDGGRIAGIAAHAWNDNLLVQAPCGLSEVVRAATRASGRPLRGFLGPWSQATAARAALGLLDAPASVAEREILYALDLDRLSVPEPLLQGRVACARASAEERDLLIDWRVAYHVDQLGRVASDAVRAHATEEIDMLAGIGALYVLHADGKPVGCTGFNALLPDCVQVGGVWTPPELRARGYARAAVAGSLLERRAAGVGRSVLFTGPENRSARRAYEALGYLAVGEYGMILLHDAHPPGRARGGMD